MKKLCTSLLLMSALVNTKGNAQTLSMACTYTDLAGTNAMDVVYASGYNYVAITHGATVTVKKIDNSCSASTFYTVTLPRPISDVKIQLHHDSLAMAIVTDIKVYLKTVAPTGILSGANEYGTMGSSPLHTYKYEGGLSLLTVSATGEPMMIEVSCGGLIRGALTHNYFGDYQSIVSDTHIGKHYMFFNGGSGVCMERRYGNLYWDNTYSIDTNVGSYITDAFQDDTSITLLIKKSGSELTKKIVRKDNGMFHDATLTYPIGPTLDGDAALHVTPSLTMIGTHMISHSSNDIGPLIISDSTTFMSDYHMLRTHLLGADRFIWSGISSMQEIKLLLMNGLVKEDSVLITDGMVNKRNSEYQTTPTSYVMCGSSDNKAKLWIFNIPYSPNTIPSLTQNHTLHLYPNPATTILHIENSTVQNVRINDIVGRTLLRYHNTSEIDVSALSPGTYIIYADTNSSIFVKR